MKIFFIILTFSLVTSSATASFKPSIPADTTRIYGIPLWQFDRLLNDAIGRRAADSAYRSLVLAIAVRNLRTVFLDSAYSQTVNANKKLLLAREAMIDAILKADQQVNLWMKEARKQKRLKVETMIVGGGIILTVLLYGHH